MRLYKKIVCLLLAFGFLFFSEKNRLLGKNRIMEPESQPVNRDLLTAGDLFNGLFPNLVHNDYFLPIGEAWPAAHKLCGTIRFAESEMTTSHPDRDGMGRGHKIFPSFSLPVISTDKYLIPLDREIIVCGNSNNSYWNIIVSPGRVWQEPGDGGYSRASFPFVFTDNYIGQARNGIATFVFNSSGISNAAVQITQETAPIDEYVIADFFGIIPAYIDFKTFTEKDRIVIDFENELAAQPHVRPWSDLPRHAFTGSFFNGGLKNHEVSTAALFIDGELYLQPPETRTGPFPYPLNMRHGVFSVTKSLAMGLSMFYLAEKYGEGLFYELISNYVPILSAHPGWQGVTFGHTLGMAVGTHGGDQYEYINNFIMARSSQEKLAAIHDLPDALPAPGESFNYASTNTFVLSYALNQYVKKKQGTDADYWRMVQENVLQPMGIKHLPVARTIESDGSLGTPIMGWGSYPNIIEALKIAHLLQNDGVFQGKQFLNRNKVREALFKTSVKGLDGGEICGRRQRYLHSLWAVEILLSTHILLAPAMRGHGGNNIVILPSGVIAIRFSDGNFYDIAPMAAVAEYYIQYYFH